jgi:ABC-2 type transport system permease protein
MGRLYLGSILGAIIGYSIAQMIANKTFKVYKYYKGLVFYGIAICLLIVGMKVDIIGYEKYVPNVDEVKSIEFDYSRYHNTIFETKENIDSIIDLHKSLVQSNDRRTPYLDGKHRYYINYTMKNGKKITRNYNINTFFDKKIKGILESTEYKTKSIPLLNVDKDKIISVVLGTRLFDSQDYIVSNREEIAELLSICKLDLWDETYEYIDKHDGNSYISFTVLKEKDDDSKEDDKNYYIEIPIKLNNKRMVEWIKKKGLEDKFILTPNNVDNITITEQIWGHYKSVDKSPDKIITNKEEIKELIELQSEDFNYRKNQIVYIIEYSNSYFHKQVKIDKEDLPSKFDKYINR